MVRVLALAGDSLAGDGAAAKLASIVRRPDNAPGERKAGQKRASWLYIFVGTRTLGSRKTASGGQRFIHRQRAQKSQQPSVKLQTSPQQVVSLSVRLAHGQECAVLSGTHCVKAHLFLRPSRLCRSDSRSCAQINLTGTRGVRTPDLALTKRMLCQLSYGGVGRDALEGVNVCGIRGREAHDPR